MRRSLALMLAITAAATALVTGSRATTVEAATQFDLPTPGPRGPVTVIGDSVLNGAGLFSPTLPDQLAARGWGPIRFRAAGSATSGLFPVATEYRSSFWIDQWQSQGWDPTHVIVNLGTNDSGFCGTNAACARNTILHLVDAIGPGHEIWWPTITKPAAASSRDVFNAALRQVAAERSDFHVWDWFGEFHGGGYQSADGIHLHPDSYRRRSDRMAEAFTAEFSRALRVGGDVPLPGADAAPGRFVALSPQRVVDTRTDGPVAVAGGSSLRVDLSEHVPDGATAAAVYVASARATADGFLASGPCGSPIAGATVNHRAGLAAGAPTVTALGTDGDVCVHASTDTDVIVDVQGYFATDAGGLAMTPLATPFRAYDTRSGEPVTELRVDVRPGVEAVAVNLAVVGATGPGFLTASPCGDDPEVANVNFSVGAPTSASAFVATPDGEFCIMVSQPVHVVVDLTAEFSVDGELLYVPVPPTRTLDTRDGTGGWAPLHGARQTLDVGVAPPDAEAVTGTVSLIRPGADSFATGWSCEGVATTASANVAAGEIGANSLTTATFGGRICLFAAHEMQTVFDTNGWWLPVTP